MSGRSIGKGFEFEMKMLTLSGDIGGQRGKDGVLVGQTVRDEFGEDEVFAHFAFVGLWVKWMV